MAKKPANEAGSAARRDPKAAAVEALLALAAEHDWHDIRLPDIAARADVSLSELRGLFPSKGAILAAFSRQIDQAVLDGIDPGMAEEPARERLFDTLMRRLDALAPHREAVRRLVGSFSHDPLSLAASNRMVVGSMQWMLAAALIDGDGPLGAARAQGLAIAWSRVLKVWLDDEDEGRGRTMTEIDKQLRAGERWMEHADDLWRLTRPFRRIAERSMARRSRFRDRMRRHFSDRAEKRSDPERGGADAI